MNINETLKEIYKLYTAWDYKKAQELNNQILVQEPDNIYATRYQNLIEKNIKSQLEPERKGAIPKVWWKTLKCPHCISKIPFSSLNQKQKDRIRRKELENLEIKCPYCHTEFLLQKRKARSFLGIKIGDKINYKQKSYRTVWYVQYVWNWYEGSYSWETVYLEWILLWNDNSYLYFSEWYSLDEEKKTYEFEFSKKVIPKKILWVDFDKKAFTLSSGSSFSNSIPFDEYNIMQVKNVYGENAKSFKIWDTVQLAPVSFWGNYVYEKENSGRQEEIGIYETRKISEYVARNIFGSQDNNKSSFNELSWSNNMNIVEILIGTFVLLWFWSVIGTESLLIKILVELSGFGLLVLMLYKVWSIWNFYNLCILQSHKWFMDYLKSLQPWHIALLICSLGIFAPVIYQETFFYKIIFPILGAAILFALLYRSVRWSQHLGAISQFILTFFIIWPLLLFLLIPLFNVIIESKNYTDLSQLWYWRKYEIDYGNLNKYEPEVLDTKKYDYGWVKTYYSQIVGIRFSVENQDDQDIILHTNSLKKSLWELWEYDQKLKEFFEWTIYKMK